MGCGFDKELTEVGRIAVRGVNCKWKGQIRGCGDSL